MAVIYTLWALLVTPLLLGWLFLRGFEWLAKKINRATAERPEKPATVQLLSVAVLTLVSMALEWSDSTTLIEGHEWVDLGIVGIVGLSIWLYYVRVHARWLKATKKREGATSTRREGGSSSSHHRRSDRVLPPHEHDAATSKPDYYKVLGVSRDTSVENIRRAFRRLALQYHPDRNKEPGAAEKFKEINEAYQVLTDPDKRAAYDQSTPAGVGRPDASSSTPPRPSTDSIYDENGRWVGWAGSPPQSPPHAGYNRTGSVRKDDYDLDDFLAHEGVYDDEWDDDDDLACEYCRHLLKHDYLITRDCWTCGFPDTDPADYRCPDDCELSFAYRAGRI